MVRERTTIVKRLGYIQFYHGEIFDSLSFITLTRPFGIRLHSRYLSSLPGTRGVFFVFSPGPGKSRLWFGISKRII